MINNENRPFKKHDVAEILVWAKNLLSDVNEANQNRSQAPTKLIAVIVCLTGILLSETGMLVWLHVFNLNLGIKNHFIGMIAGALLLINGIWLLCRKKQIFSKNSKKITTVLIVGSFSIVMLVNGMLTVIFLPIIVYLIHLILSPNVSLIITLVLFFESSVVAKFDTSIALYISTRILICAAITALLMQVISRQIISSNKKTLIVADKISRLIASLSNGLDNVENELEFVKTHDAVTKTPNELKFIKLVENNLSSATRPFFYQITCVHVGGIETSKILLSQSGHASFIIRIIEKIQNHFGSHALISRSTDTTFLIFNLLDNYEVNHLSDQLLIDEMSSPVWLDGQSLPTNVFMGVDTASSNFSDLSLTINNARNAALWAEQNGNSRLVHFQKKMQAELENHTALTSTFLDGLDAGQFELEYQPIISLGHIKVQKVEALIRWNHPTRGRVTPDQFIDLLDADQTTRMTEWVLSKSAEQLKQWHLNHGISIEVSVNIPSAYLIDILKDINGLHNRLDSFVNKHGSFVFEITEKSLLVVGDDVLNLLEMLRKQGIGISLDDFGTGYSSIKQLGALPLDYLKIDKSLIDFIDASSSSATIVGHIVRLSHELNLKVIAEGVENESQKDALAWAGCDFAQGYLFSKPITANLIPVFYRNA